MPLLQQEDLVGLTASIWEAVLGHALDPAPVADVDAAMAHTPTVTSFVAITGAWEGSVGIVLPEPCAVRAAAAMFGMDADDLDPTLVDDAVGELANIAAGNIKGMLVVECKLGLPAVVRGTDYQVTVPGTNVVCQAAFLCEGHPLKVLVQSPTSLPTVG